MCGDIGLGLTLTLTLARMKIHLTAVSIIPFSSTNVIF